LTLGKLGQGEAVAQHLATLDELWEQYEARRVNALAKYRPRLAEVGRLELGPKQEVTVHRLGLVEEETVAA
jgi:hypothetical protein